MSKSLLPPRNDQAAWIEIHAKLERAAFRAVRDRDLAAEAAQDAICEAIQADGVDASGRPAGLGLLVLRAVARALDGLRRRSRDSKNRNLEAGRLERLGRSEALRDVDPSKLFDVIEAALKVRQFLEELKPTERREVIRQLFLEQLSYEEICERMHLPSSTARSHVFHGLRNLRGRLENEGLMDHLRETLT